MSKNINKIIKNTLKVISVGIFTSVSGLPIDSFAMEQESYRATASSPSSFLPEKSANSLTQEAAAPAMAAAASRKKWEDIGTPEFKSYIKDQVFKKYSDFSGPSTIYQQQNRLQKEILEVIKSTPSNYFRINSLKHEIMDLNTQTTRYSAFEFAKELSSIIFYSIIGENENLTGNKKFFEDSITLIRDECYKSILLNAGIFQATLQADFATIMEKTKGIPTVLLETGEARVPEAAIAAAAPAMATAPR